ncbi:MAG: GDSL family lipase [Bacteroidales bacterium]|nr:GDSL family lipase [Bacteroidales bacterium]
MKRTTLLAAALLACAICSAETIKGSDPKVSYIGRTEVAEDGSVSFDWSATTIRLSFKGKTLLMACSDTKKDYFNLWIDGEQKAIEDKVVKVAGDTLITLFKAKKAATHTVILQKRTEGEQGTFSLRELTTDGTFLQAPAPKPRLIEFIGDSYTCGYGTEALHRSDPFRPEEENPCRTYADILGRMYGAEAVHISHSGRGIVRNWGDYGEGEHMVKLYAQTFDQHSDAAWTPTYKADLVIIYLGTNDFSVNKQPSLGLWCAYYKKLLQKVREFHGPAVPILCLASPCDELMDDYVQAAVDRCGLENVHAASILPGCYRMDDEDLGASWHPNYNGHRKIASVVAPFISSIMGWELPVWFNE